MKRPAAAVPPIMKRPAAAAAQMRTDAGGRCEGVPVAVEMMAAAAKVSDEASEIEVIRAASKLTMKFWSDPRPIDAVEMFSGSGVYSFWMEMAGRRVQGFDKYGRDESEDVCTLTGMAWACKIALSIKSKGTLLINPPSRQWCRRKRNMTDRDKLVNGKPSKETFEANFVAQAVAHLVLMCAMRDVFFMVIVPGDCALFFEFPVVANALRMGRAVVTTTFQGHWEREKANRKTLVSSNIPSHIIASLECERPRPDSTLIDEMDSEAADHITWMDRTVSLNDHSRFYDGFAKKLVEITSLAAGDGRIEFASPESD